MGECTKVWLKIVEKEWMTRKVFAVIVLLLGIVLLAPLFYIAQFNHMAGDCYWFAYWPHEAWNETHNIFRVMNSAFYVVGEFYKSWQGTFTSIFFFAISPGVFGEQYFFIVPYMMIGMTIFSTFLLLYAICRKVFGLDLYTWFGISGIVSLMEIEFMDAGTSGLYWYNGAVHYVFMQGFALLAVAFGILFLKKNDEKGKTVHKVILICMSSICAFFASGANFSTALISVEMLALMEIFAIILTKQTGRKSFLWMTLPSVISAVGLIANMAAPGNAVRQAYFPKQNPVLAVLSSFQYSVQGMVKWTDVYVILILFILIPFVLKAVSGSGFSFRYPLVSVLLGFCLYTSMYTPAAYAMSSEPIDRNVNICQMFYYIWLILSEIYILGFFERKFSIVRKVIPTHNKNVCTWALYILILGTVGFIGFANIPSSSKARICNSYIAWTNIENGSGKQMWNEYLTRLNEFKNNPDEVLYVEPYRTKPALLFVNSNSEVTPDEGGALDLLVARWYHKTAIYVKAKE